MAVRCEFRNYSNCYECIIKNQEIPSEVSEETFQGVHEGNRTNDDVRWLFIENSKVEKIPDKIGEVFKNVTELWITKSNLKEISKENLRQFPNLNELSLSHNDLEYLPGDLFEFNKKLEEIWLYNNKIKFIGPELLDGLPNLTGVNLQNNQNINKYYHKNDSSCILNQLKEEIKSKCKPPAELLQIQNQQKVDKQTNTKELPLKQDHKQQRNIKNKTTKNPEQNNFGISFLKDLDKFLALDDFKDFTIKVDSKVFKVHKFVFIARSPTFAEMIKNNPDADELVLTDIPVEVFESILEFVYTDQPPNNPRNAQEIFAAAGKLKIQSLMDILAETLIKEMEKEENLELLMENFNLGFKFECEELKLKSFEGIKKHFPEGKLKDELMNHPENLKKLVETKKLLDEQLKQFE